MLLVKESSRLNIKSINVKLYAGAAGAGAAGAGAAPKIISVYTHYNLQKISKWNYFFGPARVLQPIKFERTMLLESEMTPPLSFVICFDKK